jgi:probable rRNA maturation factor
MTFEASNLTVTASGTLPCVPFLAIKEKVLGKRYDLSIAFVSPIQAQALNKAHRNKEYTPNTLSFSLSETSGEIVLCKSELRKQYKKFEMSYETYIIFILIHSMLHLKGMTHGSTMESKEKQLLSFFTSSTISNETIHHSRH